MDGAWLRNSSGEGPTGAGIVVRTASGRFVAARAVNLGMTGSVLCAEAGAWRAAMEFAYALGIGTIVVEGDSQQVVRILNRDILCPTDVEVIIEDIRGLARRFVSCLFRFVRRSANVVADTLASHGVRGFGSKTWEARPLSWLLRSLGRDDHLF